MEILASAQDILFKQPLAIAGRVLSGQCVLNVDARHGPHVVHAEAAGVFYRGEDGLRMKQDIEAMREWVPQDLLGAWREVQKMPTGGARNALDWVLWQLMAAHRGEPVYRMAFLPSLRPLLTMVTLGVDDPEQMTKVARLHPSAKALKLKLEGNDIDVDRVNAVRAARPDVTLSIDANEGWSMAHLERMMGTLLACRVALIEQPLPAANDRDLQGYFSPIPIAADESLQTIEDLDQVAQRYQVANIKLDKCGGLSAAMLLIRAARERGMKVMVGCMGGRSRAIQPAFIAAQWADLVDLDAPLLMASDTTPAATYADGYIGFDNEAFAIETSERLVWANASPSRGRHAAT